MTDCQHKTVAPGTQVCCKCGVVLEFPIRAKADQMGHVKLLRFDVDSIAETKVTATVAWADVDQSTRTFVRGSPVAFDTSKPSIPDPTPDAIVMG